MNEILRIDNIGKQMIGDSDTHYRFQLFGDRKLVGRKIAPYLWIGKIMDHVNLFAKFHLGRTQIERFSKDKRNVNCSLF